MKTRWDLVLIAIIALGTFILGYQQARVKYDVATNVIQIDTFIRIDTVRDSVPVPILQYVLRFDSIPYYVAVNDTVRDTLYVRIPIEQKTFQTLEYKAVIEGYKPELTFLETYNKTVFIDRVQTVKTNPKFGFGIQVGLGTDFKKVVPYAGVGIQYNILTW